ncbi:uncharacterized protein LOC130731039 [Lotus japonicus]|uniref:uncharacterized protein LOC130731033 n=1 Tax=Lotus japonicus TaxID=34305 RepID=UPI00258B8512|nr:uncharacterized protein LOC130731033 [Lotus japonicus]XP_057439208.1 uncharacterized protein LOC130731039 [Lotus japonicus]
MHPASDKIQGQWTDTLSLQKITFCGVTQFLLYPLISQALSHIGFNFQQRTNKSQIHQYLISLCYAEPCSIINLKLDELFIMPGLPLGLEERLLIPRCGVCNELFTTMNAVCMHFISVHNPNMVSRGFYSTSPELNITPQPSNPQPAPPPPNHQPPPPNPPEESI